MDRLHQVAANPKEIIDRPVDGEKALDVAGRFEAAHLALALAGRLVRHFGTIVGVLGRAMRHGRHQGPTGCPITAQLVGDELTRCASFLTPCFQDQFSCFLKNPRKRYVENQQLTKKTCTRG